MNVVAVNGSPRKNFNTAALLEQALKGAGEAGAQTALFHLYDLDFKGCISCFACKRRSNTKPCHCYAKDGLSPVLEKVMESDVLLLGSPIYFGNVSGEMRSFMERLLFINLSYDNVQEPLFKGRIDSLFFYTMNLPSEYAGFYDALFKANRQSLSLLGGESEYFCSFDTFQFDDYSSYAAGRFDPEHKLQQKEEQFPLDCQKAFQLGRRLAEQRV